MRFWFLLVGPTLMIFVGLQWLNSVIVTFLLFYSWLLFVPILSKRFSIKEVISNERQSIWYGVISGTVFFTFIFGGLFWLHSYFLDLDVLRQLLDDWGFSGNGVFGLMFVLLCVNPILEELYWRGFMHNRIKEKGTATRAIWMTATFYTLYHFLSVIPMFQWPLNIVAVLPVFIAGLFWGYLREKTKSITAGIISHVLGDLGIMFVYWFIVR